MDLGEWLMQIFRVKCENCGTTFDFEITENKDVNSAWCPHCGKEGIYGWVFGSPVVAEIYERGIVIYDEHYKVVKIQR